MSNQKSRTFFGSSWKPQDQHNSNPPHPIHHPNTPHAAPVVRPFTKKNFISVAPCKASTLIIKYNKQENYLLFLTKHTSSHFGLKKLVFQEPTVLYAKYENNHWATLAMDAIEAIPEFTVSESNTELHLEEYKVTPIVPSSIVTVSHPSWISSIAFATWLKFAWPFDILEVWYCSVRNQPMASLISNEVASEVANEINYYTNFACSPVLKRCWCDTCTIHRSLVPDNEVKLPQVMEKDNFIYIKPEDQVPKEEAHTSDAPNWAQVWEEKKKQRLAAGLPGNDLPQVSSKGWVGEKLKPQIITKENQRTGVKPSRLPVRKETKPKDPDAWDEEPKVKELIDQFEDNWNQPKTVRRPSQDHGVQKMEIFNNAWSQPPSHRTLSQDRGVQMMEVFEDDWNQPQSHRKVGQDRSIQKMEVFEDDWNQPQPARKVTEVPIIPDRSVQNTWNQSPPNQTPNLKNPDHTVHKFEKLSDDWNQSELNRKSILAPITSRTVQKIEKFDDHWDLLQPNRLTNQPPIPHRSVQKVEIFEDNWSSPNPYTSNQPQIPTRRVEKFDNDWNSTLPQFANQTPIIPDHVVQKKPTIQNEPIFDKKSQLPIKPKDLSKSKPFVPLPSKSGKYKPPPLPNYGPLPSGKSSPKFDAPLKLFEPENKPNLRKESLNEPVSPNFSEATYQQRKREQKELFVKNGGFGRISKVNDSFSSFVQEQTKGESTFDFGRLAPNFDKDGPPRRSEMTKFGSKADDSGSQEDWNFGNTKEGKSDFASRRKSRSEPEDEFEAWKNSNQPETAEKRENNTKWRNNQENEPPRNFRGKKGGYEEDACENWNSNESGKDENVVENVWQTNFGSEAAVIDLNEPKSNVEIGNTWNDELQGLKVLAEEPTIKKEDLGNEDLNERKFQVPSRKEVMRIVRQPTGPPSIISQNKIKLTDTTSPVPMATTDVQKVDLWSEFDSNHQWSAPPAEKSDALETVSDSNATLSDHDEETTSGYKLERTDSELTAMPVHSNENGQELASSELASIAGQDELSTNEHLNEQDAVMAKGSSSTGREEEAANEKNSPDTESSSVNEIESVPNVQHVTMRENIETVEQIEQDPQIVEESEMPTSDPNQEFANNLSEATNAQPLLTTAESENTSIQETETVSNVNQNKHFEDKKMEESTTTPSDQFPGVEEVMEDNEGEITPKKQNVSNQAGDYMQLDDTNVADTESEQYLKISECTESLNTGITDVSKANANVDGSTDIDAKGVDAEEIQHVAKKVCESSSASPVGFSGKKKEDSKMTKSVGDVYGERNDLDQSGKSSESEVKPEEGTEPAALTQGIEAETV